MLSESMIIALSALMGTREMRIDDEEFGMLCNRPVECLPEGLRDKIDSIIAVGEQRLSRWRCC